MTRRDPGLLQLKHGALLVFTLMFAVRAAPVYENEQTALESYDGVENGCYYNYNHYGEGDRIVTNEPCLNCTCHNRMLMCYLRVCPFTKPIGQDCVVEKREDQCCPVITCPEAVPVELVDNSSTTVSSTDLALPDNYGCSINGRFYAEGAQVPSNTNKPCELCYCIRNMTACVMQECTLHIDGCQPIYNKGVCCPVRYSCDHDDVPLLDDHSTTTIRPTEGFVLTTPKTDTQECVYSNITYSDGSLIKTEDPCKHCYCMKGDIVCAVPECGEPLEHEDCVAEPAKKGQCCPDTYICNGSETVTIPPESQLDEQQQHIVPEKTNVKGGASSTKRKGALPDKPKDTKVDKSSEEELDDDQFTTTQSTRTEPSVSETEKAPLDDDEKEAPATTVQPEEEPATELPADKEDEKTTQKTLKVDKPGHVDDRFSEDETTSKAVVDEAEVTTVQAEKAPEAEVSKPKDETVEHEEQTTEADAEPTTVKSVAPETDEDESSGTGPVHTDEDQAQKTDKPEAVETTTMTYSEEQGMSKGDGVRGSAESGESTEDKIPTTEVPAHDEKETDSPQVAEVATEVPASEPITEQEAESTPAPSVADEQKTVPPHAETPVVKTDLDNDETTVKSEKDDEVAEPTTLAPHSDEKEAETTPAIPTRGATSDEDKSSEEESDDKATTSAPEVAEATTIPEEGSSEEDKEQVTVQAEEETTQKVESVTTPAVESLTTLKSIVKSPVDDESVEATEAPKEDETTEKPEEKDEVSVTEGPYKPTTVSSEDEKATEPATEASLESSSKKPEQDFAEVPKKEIVTELPTIDDDVPEPVTLSQMPMESDSHVVDEKTDRPDLEATTVMSEESDEMNTIIPEKTTDQPEKSHAPETTVQPDEKSATEHSADLPSQVPGEGDCLFNGISYLNHASIPTDEDCLESCVCFNSIVRCKSTCDLDSGTTLSPTAEEEDTTAVVVEVTKPSVEFPAVVKEIYPTEAPILGDDNTEENEIDTDHETTSRPIVKAPLSPESSEDDSVAPTTQQPQDEVEATTIPQVVQVTEKDLTAEKETTQGVKDSTTDAPSTESSSEDKETGEAQTTDKPVESISEHDATEKPEEKVTDKPEEKVTEQPEEKVTEQSEEKVTEQPEDKTEQPEEPATELPELVTEKSDKAVTTKSDILPEEPATEKLDDQEVKLPEEKATDKPEVATEQPELATEKPEPITEVSDEQVTLKSDEHVTELPAEHVTEKSDEQKTEAPEEPATEADVERSTYKTIHEDEEVTEPAVKTSSEADHVAETTVSSVDEQDEKTTESEAESPDQTTVLPAVPEMKKPAAPADDEDEVVKIDEAPTTVAPVKDTEEGSTEVVPEVTEEQDSQATESPEVKDSSTEKKSEETTVAATEPKDHVDETTAAAEDSSTDAPRESSETTIAPEAVTKIAVPETTYRKPGSLDDRLGSGEDEEEPSEMTTQGTRVSTEESLSQETVSPVEKETTVKALVDEPATMKDIDLDLTTMEPEKEVILDQKMGTAAPAVEKDIDGTTIVPVVAETTSAPEKSSAEEEDDEAKTTLSPIPKEPVTTRTQLKPDDEEAEVKPITDSSESDETTVKSESDETTVRSEPSSTGADEQKTEKPAEEATTVSAQLPEATTLKSAQAPVEDLTEKAPVEDLTEKAPTSSEKDSAEDETTEKTDEHVTEKELDEGMAPVTEKASDDDLEHKTEGGSQLEKEATTVVPDLSEESTEKDDSSEPATTEHGITSSATEKHLPVEDDEDKKLATPPTVEAKPTPEDEKEESTTVAASEEDETTKIQLDVDESSEAHTSPAPSEPETAKPVDEDITSKPADEDTTSKPADSSEDAESTTQKELKKPDLHAEPESDVAATTVASDHSVATEAAEEEKEPQTVEPDTHTTEIIKSSDDEEKEAQTEEPEHQTTIPVKTVDEEEKPETQTTVPVRSQFDSSEDQETTTDSKIKDAEVAEPQTEKPAEAGSHEEDEATTPKAEEPVTTPVIAEKETTEKAQPQDEKVEKTSETTVKPAAEEETTSSASEATTIQPVEGDVQATKKPHIDDSQKPIDHDHSIPEHPLEEPYTTNSPIKGGSHDSGAPAAGYPNYDEDYTEEEEDPTQFGPGTCRYGGKLYVSAQQIPRDDPCDFCFCFRSDIICLQQSCPPPIQGCHEEPISGFCCPRYECHVGMATVMNITTSTTTTTTTLPPHFVNSYKGAARKAGCLIQGKAYSAGDEVFDSSTPCMKCECGGDAQMKCEPRKCGAGPMLQQMIAAAQRKKR